MLCTVGSGHTIWPNMCRIAALQNVHYCAKTLKQGLTFVSIGHIGLNYVYKAVDAVIQHNADHVLNSLRLVFLSMCQSGKSFCKSCPSKCFLHFPICDEMGSPFSLFVTLEDVELTVQPANGWGVTARHIFFLSRFILSYSSCTILF